MPKGFVIVSVVLLFSFSCFSQTDRKSFSEAVAPLFDNSLKPFYHGVASGDPLTNAVVIWTRVSADDSLATIDVRWELSETRDFKKINQFGNKPTSAATDFTVKVDIQKLSPGTIYYYRFTALGRTSPVGRTKTIATNPKQISIAVVSCSNWEFGYFNPYYGIAKKDVDAVVHLGDYIYETPRGGYANPKVLDRKHLPANELITLADYRTRYSQYHLDAALREARMQHPFITVWDDHEVANDVYVSGALAHDPATEGSFEKRKAAAKQAYYEWMPIREQKKLYRAFAFGNLASLIMLDERLEAREKQLSNNDDPALFSKRTMLGQEQLEWFESQLSSKASTWKIIGNQVLFSDLDRVPKVKGHQRNLDSWDGYPVEKKAIEEYIVKNKIDNIVFLAGDTHASWAFNVIPNPFETNPQRSVAVEFGATSISSGNLNESQPDDSVRVGEQNLIKSNPHLKYVNQRDHGYIILKATNNEVTAQFYLVETLMRPDDRERVEKTFKVLSHASQLTEIGK